MGEHRVPRRDGRVLKILRPWDACVPVRRREEESSLFLVGEELDGEQDEPPCFEEPVELPGGDVELEEAVCDVRVVVEEPEAARPAVSDRAVQSSVVRRQRAEQERPEPPRGIEPIGSLEAVPRLGERGEREPVPRRERLVVAERLRTGVPLDEQSPAEIGIEGTPHDEATVLERLERLARQASRI